MTISIDRTTGHKLAEVREVRVNGLPGIGSYTLALNLYFSVTAPAETEYLHNLAMRVDWGDSAQRMIGAATPDSAQPIEITKYASDLQLGFRLVLMQNQLEAIEERRNGGDFSLRLWMTGEVTGVGGHRSFQETDKFVVRQQDWVEALEKMGYRRSLLYEIPIPAFTPEQVDAKKIIRKAQDHLARGHYDDCVGTCRTLLEAYPPSESDARLVSDARGKYKGNTSQRQSMEISERIAVMRDAVTHATHLAHHPNPGDGYSRDQARLILGATLLHWGLLSGKVGEYSGSDDG